MKTDAEYKQMYLADKELLGDILKLSEEDYIASLKITDSGGELTGIFYGNGNPTSEDILELNKKTNDPADDKYRLQYQADKELLGSMLTLSEEDYIDSLKATESGGYVSLC